MKKLFFIIFSLILIFSFSLCVNAECSYKERTQLLNEAKGVEIFFEVAERIESSYGTNPNSGETALIENTITYLKMNFSNITDNIFIKVINKYNDESFIVSKDDLINGIYSISIYDISNIFNYDVEYYSTLESCYANKIYTKEYKKPKFNSVSEYLVCSNDFVADSKYCQSFIDTDFGKTDIEIVEYLNSLIDKKIEEQKGDNSEHSFLELLKIYWYIPTIIVGSVILLVIVVVVIKKRGELK